MSGVAYLNNQKKLYINLNDYTLGDTLEFLIESESKGFLFHGSRHKLEYLNTCITHLDNSEVVFAGKLWSAISFIPRWDDTMIGHGTVNNIPYIKNKSKSIEEVFNCYGYIHLVSPEHFNHTSKLTNFEFVSYCNIKVEHVVKVCDILNCFNKLDVVLN